MFEPKQNIQHDKPSCWIHHLWLTVVRWSIPPKSLCYRINFGFFSALFSYPVSWHEFLDFPALISTKFLRGFFIIFLRTAVFEQENKITVNVQQESCSNHVIILVQALRNLVGKRSVQKDTIKDMTSDSQMISYFHTGDHRLTFNSETDSVNNNQSINNCINAFIVEILN